MCRRKATIHVVGLMLMMTVMGDAAAQCTAQVSTGMSGEAVTVQASATPTSDGRAGRITLYVDDQAEASPPCFTGTGETCEHQFNVWTGCRTDGGHTIRIVADCTGGSDEATTGFSLSGAPFVQITNDGMNAEGDVGGLINYDFRRGTGTLSFTLETPYGSDGFNPVIMQQAGSFTWNHGTACWPADSYQMTARITRCSGEVTIDEPELVVPPHKPTIQLGLLDNDKTKAIVNWTFPQTKDFLRKVTVVREPAGTTEWQSGSTATSPGEAVINLPACTWGSDYLIARALACDDFAAGFAESAPLSLPKCETNSCPTKPANSVGKPVHIVSGNMRLTDSDPLPGGFVAPLQRTYDSRRTMGAFGNGWTSIFDAQLVANGEPDDVDLIDVYTEKGERFLFVREAGIYRQIRPVPVGAPGSLVQDAAGDFLHREAGSGLIRVFRGGKLMALREAGTSREVVIAYDANGRPLTVTDTRGSWSWTIATDGTTGRVTSISVDGHPEMVWTYTIDGGGSLTAVHTAGAVWRTYTYGSGGLETARDGGGHLIESHVYDATGQALTSSGGNGEITNIAYDLPGREPGEWRTLVTYASGRTTDFYSRSIAGQMRTVQIDGSCDCGSEDSVYAYDASGRVVREQDAAGYVLERQYTGDRLTAETMHLRPGSCDPATDPQYCRLTPATLASAALVATGATRTVAYEYSDPLWPDRITQATTESVFQAGSLRRETFTHDAASGTVLAHSVTGWTDSPVREETHTTLTALYDGSEGAAFNPGSWFPQDWRTLPQPSKQRKSINGPRPGNGDLTSFVYYPVDASIPANLRGQLAATRNPAGHVTRYEGHDVFGNATRVTDPNGVTTETTVDAPGRLLTTTLEGVAGCDTSADPLCGSDITTTRVYAGNGPLVNETREGSGTSYTYDDRGRVVTTSRGPSLADLRERIEWTYDPDTALKTQERVLGLENGSWVEKKRESYGYNTSEQLSRIVHPDGTSAGYTYGPESRLLSVRDENHTQPNTLYDYDPAGRLQKVTQTLPTAPGGAVHTSYSYDREGNLTAVTDPNGNVTTYRYDDFGRMVEQLSPVTGSTRYKYAAAGNLVETTTAEGTVTTRDYDSSGRVLSATSTRDERSETVTWTYDAGAFGKGRLTAMSDPTGAAAYLYDRRGLLLSETRTIGSATYTTSFGYDLEGNRTRMRYPSGRIVDYTFDYGSRPVTATTEGTALVVSASYLPFGPLRELVLGNGTTRSMTYDQRYRLLTNRLTGPVTSGEGEETAGVIASYQYTYDPSGNITRIADLTDLSFDRNFGYDDLNRLITAIGGPGLWGAGSYTYDAMGNMRSASVGENLRTFAMNGTTPKIASVTTNGRVDAVSYDATGNEIAVGAQTYDYSARDHLRTAGELSYDYDGRGIRTTTRYAVTLAAFSLDVATASPNQTVTGVVSLSALAPAGGLAVRLRSSSSAVTLPVEVVVAAGQASATFTATVAADAPAGTVTLTAAYATSLSATLTVTESPALTAFTATPAEVVGGNPITVQVTLAAAAPEGGAIVAITAEREEVASGTMTIDAEEVTGTMQLETYAVPFAVTVPLTASYGGSTLQASVQVTPETLVDRLTIAPDGVLGGESTNGTITLSAPAPAGGRVFTLTSANAAATVPSSVEVSEGTHTVTFLVTTSAVAAATPVIITATEGSTTLQATLTVVCPTGATSEPTFPEGQTVFIDESLPAGAAMSGALRWDLSQKASGETSLVAIYAGSGVYRTTMTGLGEPIAGNEKLFAYARVADCAVPRQILLRAKAAGQWFTAYWGEPLWGVMPTSINMGAVPAGGSWQRLDVLLRDLDTGGGDAVISELEIVHVDGQVWFDRIGRMADCVAEPAAPPTVPGDEDVVIDDDAPEWITFASESNALLGWTSTQSASGGLSLVHPYRGQGTSVTALTNFAQPLVAGSKLSLYALVDSCSMPVRQVHLRITTTAGSRTVSWGEPLWDIEPDTLDQGPVPPGGAWTRLEIPLADLGLDSGTLTRLDIAHVDGRVWFDRFAFWPSVRAQLTSFVSDHESTVSAGTTVTWTATATGTIPPLEYRYERRDDLGNWSIVQPYGMQATYTWTPTVADIGTNAVRVSVRNAGSTADFEDTATLLLRVLEGGGEEGLLLRDPQVHLAWWKRWFRPRVPASLGVDYGSIVTTSESPAFRHSLYTPELQLLAETEITTTASPAIAYEYIWFAGQPLAQVTTTTGAIDWYFNDHLGTPILQIGAQANVVWRVEYDPYGSVFATRTGPEKYQLLRFPGQENEGYSELSYNVFRHYRASWGRYTQSDWIGLAGGLNLYAYAADNALRFTDPRGLLNQDNTKPKPGEPYCDFGVCTPPLPKPPNTPSCVGVVVGWAMKALLKKTQGLNDKYLHCMAGCEIAKACGEDINAAIAGAKEKLDALGFGTADIYDAIATVAGGECVGVSLSCDCCCKSKGFNP